MPEVSNLLLNPIFQPVWIMLIVMLVERFLNWPDKYHPLSFFRLLARNIDKKVRPGSADSVTQQKISGSLAAIVLLVPFLLVLALLINIAEYPQFFNAILLLAALQFSPFLKRYKKIRLALASNKKALARSILAPMVLRETDKLSPMGIAKAASESLLLRFGYQYVSVLFWYLLLGGLGAFTYRLLYEFSQIWNTKLAKYRNFGRPARTIVNFLSWFPIRFFVLALALAENLTGARQAAKKVSSVKQSSIRVLASHGGAMGFQMSGPAYYTGQKIRKKKVGGQREIRFDDMQRVTNSMTKANLILLCFLVLGVAVIYAALQGSR